MRYYINFDKTVNQLVPHYIGGRKLILYLQALLKPLQRLNEAFVEWAKETKIEAAMTSQVFKLEWFLNRKFRKYFKDSTDVIAIGTHSYPGIAIYYENAEDVEHMFLYAQDENIQSAPLFFHNERTSNSNCSFIVYSPQINESLISRDSYTAMLAYYINKYKLAGKTYKINFKS